MSKRKEMVAIVGRQNVGKSTLFNMLIGEPKAIVSPVQGTTRDTTSAEFTWRGSTWELVDTGGIEEAPEQDVEQSVRERALVLLKQSAVICFVVDGMVGLTREDTAIARELRRYARKVILVINKIDGPRLRAQVPPELLSMGFAEVVMVSAKNGSGTGDLLDIVAQILPAKSNATDVAVRPLRLVVLGKPNVGKSSIINRIVNEERVIVSPTPHTTRDAQDVKFTYQGTPFILVDTAGMRRGVPLHARLTMQTEKDIMTASMQQAAESLHHADVAAIVLDATQPITAQDRKIIELAVEAKVGMMLLFNKWDLVPDKSATSLFAFQKDVYADLAFLTWVPMLCVSAKSGQRVFGILKTAKEIAAARTKKIDDEAIAQFVRTKIMPRWPIRAKGGKLRYSVYVTQLDTIPPTFRVRTTGKEVLHTAQQRFLMNELRSHFRFLGTPITLLVEKTLRRQQ